MHFTLTSNKAIHERYEEMCAVAAIGELRDGEFDELQEHISLCDQCRRLYREFCRISANDLGAFAVARQSEACKFGAPPLFGVPPLDDLLSKCISRATIEPSNRSLLPAFSPPKAQTKPLFASLFPPLRRRRLAYILAAASVIFASGLIGFETSNRQLRPQISELRDRLSQAASPALQASLERPAAAEPGVIASVDERMEKLALRLRARTEQYGLLTKQKQQLRQQLASATARLDELNAQAQNYQLRWQQEHAARTDLQSQLSQTQEELGKQEQASADLTVKLRLKEQEITELAPRDLGVKDGEAKSLFGARDLHIVDVYDVDGHGNTRRSFGRVYYVEKKLLLFYAFDLEDKKHNRATAGFQAWGYREANADKPQNLGLFYVDDASINRWVLKVNNPKVLDHVEVVFVTLEPPQGSSTPKGRRLLYANLGGAPNHP